jgi:hypothetical protein
MAGQLDPALQKVLFGGQAECDLQARGQLGLGQPLYSVFAPGGKGPPRFDRELKEPFDFSGVVGAFGSGGGALTLAECGLYQTEYSLLARFARDFRLRRRTRLQARAHGIARLRALGHPEGQLTGPLLEDLKNWLEAGTPPS